MMPSQKPRLRMLKPKLSTLDPWKARGLKMLDTRPSRAKATGRDADPTRVLPLNGYAWQKLRAMVLAGEPLCRHCATQGLTVPATDVDHMNGADDNRLESLQPLCHECHSRKTAAEQGKRTTAPVGIDGMPQAWRDAP